MPTLDRRRFLAAATAATATSVAASAAVARRTGTARPAIKSPLIINALGALEDPNPDPAKAAPTASDPVADPKPALLSNRILRDAQASGLTAVNVTLGYVAGASEPFEHSIRDVARMDALIRRQSADLLKVYSAADIGRARAEHKIGVIYGFQNSAMLGNDVGRVDVFADLGVRVMQLTYNPANGLGDGSAAPGNRGLTPFGRQAVAQLNQRRIIVDLSHSGETTCLDAARASTQPISINHTGCRALNDLPRNKTDEELRLVATRGGFIGIYFMPFLNPSGHATADDVVRHLEHAVNVCGEDHVGIGTDGSVTGIDDLDRYRATLAAEVAARQAAGISAAGERADTLPFVVDLRGVDQFRRLAQLLQRRGYGSARIDKILGVNFLRFAHDVWGG